MFRQRAGGRGIFLDDGNKRVCVLGDRVEDEGKRREGVEEGPGAVDGAGASERIKILEKGEVGLVDGYEPLFLPLRHGVVQQLGCAEGDQVPWVAGVVDIFGVAADGDALFGGNAGVDGIQRGIAEGVDEDLEGAQYLAVARLEGGRVAFGVDVEDGERPQEGVGVDAGAGKVGDVDVA